MRERPHPVRSYTGGGTIPRMGTAPQFTALVLADNQVPELSTNPTISRYSISGRVP